MPHQHAAISTVHSRNQQQSAVKKYSREAEKSTQPSKSNSLDKNERENAREETSEQAKEER